MAKAAKKRKKEEDDDFALPAFDEAAYMRKEIELAKVSFVTIALALPVALLLYALTVAANVPVVAFFVGLGLTFLLPRIFHFLPWPKLATEKLERRDWLGHGGTFLFSWLAFWILLLNVPFVDVTAPVITSVTAFAGVQQVPIQEGAAPIVRHAPGNNTLINASVFENRQLDQLQLYVEPNPTPVDYTSRVGSRYSWVLILPDSNHKIVIVATDAAGHRTEFAFEINLQP